MIVVDVDPSSGPDIDDDCDNDYELYPNGNYRSGDSRPTEDKDMPNRTTLILSVAALLLNAAPADVPPPWETPVEIVVSGRTSTLKSIKIVKVGQQVPRTYAGRKMANTPGFTWYVSQHYALKSQMDEAFSHRMLEVSELAYPHWVQIIGREPPGIEYTRMAIVYAKDRKAVDTAVGTDFGTFWAGSGGGVTFPHNKTAYNYPSGTLRYHKRDLVIHENLHMLDMCATGGKAPLRFVEGITHTASNHVYEEQKKQLTIAVFDKATVNNPIDSQLAGLRKKFFSIPEFIEGAKGQPICVYTQYFWTDPERLMKWRLWRDGLFSLKPWDDVKEHDERLMREVFGSIEKLNAAWRVWVNERHNSFHFVEWGWEQSGNMLWSYGWPWDKKAYSQTNLRYAPQEPTTFDTLRLDYPAEPMPATVGPVRRGVPEPSVGCVVDFSNRPGAGRAGLGLGVIEKSYCPILIDGGKKLTFGGYTFGVPLKAFPVPAAVQNAAKADGHRFGLTVRIKKAALEAIVRAGKPEGLKEMKASVPISGEQRKRMMEKYVAVISKDSRHGITPFIDDLRKMPADLSKPAPTNRWRFAGLNPLYGLYKAAFRLGGEAPDSLTELRDRMLAAVDRESDVQEQAVRAYETGIQQVMKDLRSCGAEPKDAEAALVDLTGLWMDLEVTDDSVPDHLQMTASIGGIFGREASGELKLAADPPSVFIIDPEAEPVRLTPGKQVVTRRTYRLTSGSEPFSVSAEAKVVWRGEEIRLSAVQGCRTSVPRWWTIGPLDNGGDGTKDTRHAIEMEKVNLKRKYMGKDRKTIAWQKAERPRGLSATGEHLVDFNAMYGGANVAAYALVWVESEQEADALLALGSDDGVVAWFNGKRVHTNMVARGYGSKQDVVPVKLRSGKNALMIKVAQGGGGWSLCAHLLDPEGNPLRGIRYVLRD